MVRLLYIVSTLKRSGPTNVLYNLIAELDKNQFTPIILTLSPENDKFPSSLKSFEGMGVEIHSLHLSRIKGLVSAAAQIKKFVADQNVKVIHLFGFRGDLLIKPKHYKGITIISTINSNIFDDYTMLYGKLKGKIMASLHINSLKGKTGIACSQFVADKLNERYNIVLDVIYNGIPKQHYTISTPNEKAQTKEQLQLPRDKRIFIFVGSLIFRKNPLTIIKGFLNNENLDNAHLVMIGDGPLMEECKAVCKDNVDRVSFFGNQPETLKFLKASDYYIAASYSEGLPTSVMEAMGCGIPVILSDIAPHEELVTHIDNWKYIFPANDVNTLSEKISTILKDDYSTLSLQCRGIINEYFNSELMARNYQLLYQKANI
jgi:glycosyltransferase involved in cell wall biosynthesis